MNDEEHEDPFYRGVRRELYSSWEFEDFQRKVAAHIEALASNNPRLQQMKTAVGFYIDNGHEGQVQVWFGVYRRRKLDKKLLSENGARLVYSRPFVGAGVVTTLFPAKSDDARVNEDRIYIRIGDFSSAQLMGWVKKDLANLIAYAHVTNIDGTPTIAERFRVGWLRRFH
ncbi:MAG TPA: hypothetical protein VGN75_06430, partial [Kaistia sp.]|nr:hypothetical protein [Kaistia sp.]